MQTFIQIDRFEFYNSKSKSDLMANRGKRKYFLDFQEMKENTGEQLPSH